MAVAETQDAKLLQLALDSQVAPARVLLRKSEDQHCRLTRNSRPTRLSLASVGPPTSHELAVPAQHGLWRDRETPPQVARQ